MIKKLKSVNTSWFFSDIPSFLKCSTIYVKGDIIVLLPLIVVILLSAFISVKLMLILLGIYLVVRYLGEMIYWLLHQFGSRQYRPDDFGFKNLDNHSIYILYQTMATMWIMIGAALVVATIMYWK